MSLQDTYLDNKNIGFVEGVVHLFDNYNAIFHNAMPSFITDTDCILCHSPEKIDIGEDAIGEVVSQCKSCGLFFLSKRLNDVGNRLLCLNYVPTCIQAGYSEEDKANKLKTMNRELDVVESFAFKGDLLDVGAAGGDFLVYARDRGWNIDGTELSFACIMLVEYLFDIQLKYGEIFDIAFGKTYDVIIMRHVIEHTRLPDWAVATAKSLLNENGILYITTPAVEALDDIKDTPYHVAWYTEDTLSHLLSGFEIVLLTKRDKELTIIGRKV